MLMAHYKVSLNNRVNQSKITDPFKVKTVSSFLPRHVTPRITAQSGLFTIHPKPDSDWDDKNITALLLNFDKKTWLECTRRLFRFGIHEHSLFPDINGLCSHLNFMYGRGLSLKYVHFAEEEIKE